MTNLLTRMFGSVVSDEGEYPNHKKISKEFEIYLSEIDNRFEKPLKHLIYRYSFQQCSEFRKIVRERNFSTSNSSIHNALDEFVRLLQSFNSFSEFHPLVTFIDDFFMDDEPCVTRDKLTLYLLIKFVEEFITLKNPDAYQDVSFAREFTKIQTLEDCEKLTGKSLRGLVPLFVMEEIGAKPSDFLLHLILSIIQVCDSQKFFSKKNLDI